MKRHTKQSDKQKSGEYYTTNSDIILAGWEHYVQNKTVIDPFAGSGDLLQWADINNAKKTEGYDINNKWPYRDTIQNPAECHNKFLLSNPPYLSKNKYKGDKSIFDRYKQNDLYKLHIASLIDSNVEQGILIIPTNFLCESRSKIRKTFFKNYRIIECKYWSTPIFDDASTGVVAFVFEKGDNKPFPVTIYPENKTIDIHLEEDYNYIWGKDYFDYVDIPHKIKIVKTNKGMKPANTSIVAGLLDLGKRPQGLSMNYGECIYTNPSAFTTYQLTIPEYELTIKEQEFIVHRFNQVLSKYRTQYDGMFLANYMGPNQKIIGRSIINNIISKIVLHEM